MDYTKLEAAIREKEIAEMMIKNNDYKGARDKLIKIRNLYPTLDNISEMITVCDILCTTDFGLPGIEIDWYWVLQINVAADESHIKSKYQILTTVLEPIKNTFPGTETALTLIQNAFSVLSNRTKRLMFDSKRVTSWGLMQDQSNLKIMNKETKASSQSSFGCERVASETSDRLRNFNRNDLFSENGMLNSPMSMGCNGSGSDFYDFDNNRKVELLAVGQIWATYDQENMPRSYIQIKSIRHAPFKMHVTWLRPSPVTEHERKWCEVGLPVACGYFEPERSNVVVGVQTKFSHMVSQVKGLTDEKLEIYPQKGEVWVLYRDWHPFIWCSDPTTRKGCRFQMVEILTSYSKDTGVKVACLEKVAGFRSIFQRCLNEGNEFSFQIPAGHLLKFSHSVPIFRFMGGEMDKISDGMIEIDPLAVPGDLVHGTTKPLEGGSSSDCSSSTPHHSLSPHVISNLETISLKPKWSRKDFCSDQIWAVYDGPDSMPRRYTKVNNVASGSEVNVTFLEPHLMHDVETHWVKEDLPFGCGLFRASRITLDMSMSRFSHLVTCEYSEHKSLYRIYPKKGEIWATYKKWNAKWKLSDFSCYQCQVVEIISDFSEDAEMKIASLIEVEGFMTFFQRQLHDGFELIRAVPTSEMLSFSHQIPSFSVPGIENYGIAKGSLHVEPSALPSKLTN